MTGNHGIEADDHWSRCYGYKCAQLNLGELTLKFSFKAFVTLYHHIHYILTTIKL